MIKIETKNIKLDSKKGITLIALIITIIVMLILVAVTVNISLNGGLFSKAKMSTEGYEMQEIKEQAQVIVADAFAEATKNNETVTWEKAISAINDGFESSTKVGNIITTADGKYDIRINEDYTIEVAKAGELENTYAPTGIIILDNIWTMEDYNSFETPIWITGSVNKEALVNYLFGNTSQEEMFEYIKSDWGSPYNESNSYEEFIVKVFKEEYLSNYNENDSKIEDILEEDEIKALGINSPEELYYYYYDDIFGNADKIANNNSMTLTELLKNEYLWDMNNKYRKLENLISSLEIEIISPSGEKALVNGAYNFKYVNHFQNSNYSISKNGEYIFNIIINGKICGKYRYNVTEIKAYLSKCVNVGDYVAYDAGVIDESTGELYSSTVNQQIFTTNSDIRWRVISKNGSNTILISESPLYDDEGNVLTGVYESKTKYQDALNKICGIYGHGKGATESKSVSKSEIKTSDANSIEYKIIYEDVNNENDSISYLLYDSRIEGVAIYDSGTYTHYYSYVQYKKIEEGMLSHGGFEGTLNPQYKEHTYKVSGAIRPIVVLESDLKTWGQDENGVWQLTE